MPFHLNRRLVGIVLLAVTCSAAASSGFASGSAESPATWDRWVTIVDLLKKPSQHLKENKPELRLSSGKRQTFTLMPWGPELRSALSTIDTYLARHESARRMLAKIKPHLSGIYIADFVVHESGNWRRYDDKIPSFAYYDRTLGDTGRYVVFINSLLFVCYLTPDVNSAAPNECQKRLIDAFLASLNDVHRAIEAERWTEVAITVEESEEEEELEEERGLNVGSDRYAPQPETVSTGFLQYCTIL